MNAQTQALENHDGQDVETVDGNTQIEEKSEIDVERAETTE